MFRVAGMGSRGGDQPQREEPEREAMLERGPQHREARECSRDVRAQGVI